MCVRVAGSLAAAWQPHGPLSADAWAEIGRENFDTLEDLAHVYSYSQGIRNWAPKPVRWLASQGIYSAYGLAGRVKNRGSAKTSVVARIADSISGR